MEFKCDYETNIKAVLFFGGRKSCFNVIKRPSLHVRIVDWFFFLATGNAKNATYKSLSKLVKFTEIYLKTFGLIWSSCFRLDHSKFEKQSCNQSFEKLFRRVSPSGKPQTRMLLSKLESFIHHLLCPSALCRRLFKLHKNEIMSDTSLSSTVCPTRSSAK